jgi:uncharacterized protein YqgC (DUF456 family)
MTRGGGRGRNNSRLKTFLWIAGMAILIIGLIYFEQTAILYVLATVGVTVLLLVVALADLSGAHRTGASELGDDAAAIGSGITGAPAARTGGRTTAAAKRK